MYISSMGVPGDFRKWHQPSKLVLLLHTSCPMLLISTMLRTITLRVVRLSSGSQGCESGRVEDCLEP